VFLIFEFLKSGKDLLDNHSYYFRPDLVHVVLENNVDSYDSTQSHVFAHVREEARELQQLVLDGQPHPVVDGAHVHHHLLAHCQETCLDLEYVVS